MCIKTFAQDDDGMNEHTRTTQQTCCAVCIGKKKVKSNQRESRPYQHA